MFLSTGLHTSVISLLCPKFQRSFVFEQTLIFSEHRMTNLPYPMQICESNSSLKFGDFSLAKLLVYAGDFSCLSFHLSSSLLAWFHRVAACGFFTAAVFECVQKKFESWCGCCFGILG